MICGNISKVYMPMVLSLGIVSIIIKHKIYLRLVLLRNQRLGFSETTRQEVGQTLAGERDAQDTRIEG